MLPEIRTDLFGKNPNRKFYNVRAARSLRMCHTALLICIESSVTVVIREALWLLGSEYT